MPSTASEEMQDQLILISIGNWFQNKVFGTNYGFISLPYTHLERLDQM